MVSEVGDTPPRPFDGKRSVFAQQFFAEYIPFSVQIRLGILEKIAHIEVTARTQNPAHLFNHRIPFGPRWNDGKKGLRHREVEGITSEWQLSCVTGDKCG